MSALVGPRETFSGVCFPVLMKLLGHLDPGMTMRHVDGALTDPEREFHLAHSKPRHMAPQPKTSTAPVGAGFDGLIDSLLVAQHSWRCSAVLSQTVMLAIVCSDSPNASSRSCPR